MGQIAMAPNTAYGSTATGVVNVESYVKENQ